MFSKLESEIQDPESDSALQKICTRIQNPNPPFFGQIAIPDINIYRPIIDSNYMHNKDDDIHKLLIIKTE